MKTYQNTKVVHFHWPTTTCLRQIGAQMYRLSRPWSAVILQVLRGCNRVIQILRHLLISVIRCFFTSIDSVAFQSYRHSKSTYLVAWTIIKLPCWKTVTSVFCKKITVCLIFLFYRPFSEIPKEECCWQKLCNRLHFVFSSQSKNLPCIGVGGYT